LFKRAAERGVAIEIDGDVSRQDLDFRIATAAKKAGCVLAHARLAGISKERIINYWPIERILEWARTFRPLPASNASNTVNLGRQSPF
jgi:hypothetical protein